VLSSSSDRSSRYLSTKLHDVTPQCILCYIQYLFCDVTVCHWTCSEDTAIPATARHINCQTQVRTSEANSHARRAHPLASVFEVKNTWNYSSTGPYVFLSLCLIQHRDSSTPLSYPTVYHSAPRALLNADDFFSSWQACSLRSNSENCVQLHNTICLLLCLHKEPRVNFPNHVSSVVCQFTRISRPFSFILNCIDGHKEEGDVSFWRMCK
jgi:hypothetical protein